MSMRQLNFSISIFLGLLILLFLPIQPMHRSLSADDIAQLDDDDGSGVGVWHVPVAQTVSREPSDISQDSSIPARPLPRLSDLFLNPATLDEIQEVEGMLRNPANPRNRHGIIIHGASGLGKTTLVQALAGKTESKLLELSGAEVVDRYVGSGSQRILRSFEEAKAERDRSVVFFIDEIDTFAHSELARTEVNEYYSASVALNQILDQCEERHKNIFVIGTTNFYDRLHKTLRRRCLPIKIELPDTERRTEIITHTADRFALLLESDVIDRFTRLTKKWGGGDIISMIQAAQRVADREMRQAGDEPPDLLSLTYCDLHAGYKRILSTRTDGTLLHRTFNWMKENQAVCGITLGAVSIPLTICLHRAQQRMQLQLHKEQMSHQSTVVDTSTVSRMIEFAASAVPLIAKLVLQKGN